MSSREQDDHRGNVVPGKTSETTFHIRLVINANTDWKCKVFDIDKTKRRLQKRLAEHKYVARKITH